MRGKKSRKKIKVASAELNIMPFIDIFSMLNTFLLVSAAFVNIGILKVQAPFLSNAKDPKDNKPTRVLEVNVEVDKDKIELVQIWSQPPDNKKTEEFPLTAEGADRLHAQLVSIRTKEPDTDKVTLFSENEVVYKDLILVIDAIKQKKPSDPPITVKDDQGVARETGFVYEKVVMGSVIL